jgi:hypothetical protein
MRMALPKLLIARWAKVLRFIGLACVIPAGLWPWYLLYRVPQLSQTPNAGVGLIAPFNNHGTIVYMTRLESCLTNGSFFVMAAGFLALFASRKIEGKNFLGRWDT